ncbi:hypothetical protein SLE2022_321550 [Rubroshorea leprosula]
MDAEEEGEKKRVTLADDPSNKAMVTLADDPSNKAMVQKDLHPLPPDILLEILSRLPITSLIHFKTTSHACYDLIADPRLPPMFHNRVSDSNPCLILYNHNSVARRPLQLYFVDSEDCSRRVRKIDPPQHSEVYNLVGSCNGLLCVSYPNPTLWRTRSLLIYNPFVGHAVSVPPAKELLNQSEFFGFGCHPRTGEFKLVRIVYYQKIMTVVDPALDVEEVDEESVEEVDEESVEEVDEEFVTVDKSMVQVLTVGTTKWRNKGATPPHLVDVFRPPEAQVEGSLLWVTVVGIGELGSILGIISFDLADEVFEEIPHPPCEQLVSGGYSLSVLNRCLSAAGLPDSVHFDIWVMKQYRVKESWVKQLSFDFFFIFGGRPSAWPRRLPKVICALKNGEILLEHNYGSLVSYDPVEHRSKTLQMIALPRHFQALPFLPSLFSAEATVNLQL